MDRPAAKRPSCILLLDNVGYLGASTALESLGLSVPEDISCFGYGGIHMTRVLRPSLATYKQDARKTGQVAAEHLHSNPPLVGSKAGFVSLSNFGENRAGLKAP